MEQARELKRLQREFKLDRHPDGALWQYAGS
jgi:hypothetical protein